MELEQAITTAIAYEERVRDTYLEAVNEATDATGKKVFQTLADEEQGHVGYLRSRLEEWKKTGAIQAEALATVVPSADTIQQGIRALKEKVARPRAPLDPELKMLRRALAVEVETSDFYKKMAREMDATGQQLFDRFVEIEEGHQAIVQAEIDSVSGMGFWFDFREFDLESA